MSATKKAMQKLFFCNSLTFWQKCSKIYLSKQNHFTEEIYV